jgi:quinol-cytochrome oxidoreductase complex cytochrome b subunit
VSIYAVLVNQEPSNQTRRIRSVPDLVRKEGLAALIALAAVGLLSVLADAPIEGPADPSGLATEHVKAPWIFVGIQQMLRYLPPILAGIAIPAGALLALALVPYAYRKRILTRVLFWGIVAAVVILTVWGYFA